MPPFFLWVFMAFVTIVVFARSYPDEILQMCRRLRRWLRAFYAHRYGEAAAASDLPSVYWDAQPWERHWPPSPLPSSPPLRLWDLYWSHHLDTVNFLKLVTLVWLIRLGLIKVESIKKSNKGGEGPGADELGQAPLNHVNG